MVSKNQLTGMRGVYLVAAELSRLGPIASPTSRSAIGADILATDKACTETFLVQVKTNATTFAFWLVGKKAKTIISDSHIYVLVNLRSNKRSGAETIEYYIVPSAIVAKRMKTETEWPNIRLADVEGFKDRWDYFNSSDRTSCPSKPKNLKLVAN